MPIPKFPRKAQLAIGAAVLLGFGAAGGAAATSLTRPSVQMAPTVQTPIAKLASTSGVVTVRGTIAETYGDRIVLQDASGRAMVDVGRSTQAALKIGAALMVQGRYDDGQMRAAYLVDPSGAVTAVGPGGPGGPGGRHHGPGGPGGPGGERLRGGSPRPGASDPASPPPPPPGANGAPQPNCQPVDATRPRGDLAPSPAPR